jgi:hypothetical protein
VWDRLIAWLTPLKRALKRVLAGEPMLKGWLSPVGIASPLAMLVCVAWLFPVNASSEI